MRVVNDSSNFNPDAANCPRGTSRSNPILSNLFHLAGRLLRQKTLSFRGKKRPCTRTFRSSHAARGYCDYGTFMTAERILLEKLVCIEYMLKWIIFIEQYFL